MIPLPETSRVRLCEGRDGSGRKVWFFTWFLIDSRNSWVGVIHLSESIEGIILAHKKEEVGSGLAYQSQIKS
jgi:hypothetical protein